VDRRFLGLSHHRHRARQLWAYYELGWAVVVLGSRRERLVHALAGRHRIDPLAGRHRKARRLQNPGRCLLAIFAFSLSLLGTFLVRSGVLVSVHAFATDPGRGVFILAFLATSSAVRSPCTPGAHHA